MILFFQLQRVKGEEPQSMLTPAHSDNDTINVAQSEMDR